MKHRHKYSEIQRKHFLMGIEGQSTLEDRPVLEIIAVDYRGNTDDYIDAMLRFDPRCRRYLS